MQSEVVRFICVLFSNLWHLFKLLSPGICKTVPLNTRWLGYACYIWCITQYCKNRGTYSGWKAEDTVGPQKGWLAFEVQTLRLSNFSIAALH